MCTMAINSCTCIIHSPPTCTQELTPPLQVVVLRNHSSQHSTGDNTRTESVSSNSSNSTRSGIIIDIQYNYTYMYSMQNNTQAIDNCFTITYEYTNSNMSINTVATTADITIIPRRIRRISTKFVPNDVS